MAREVSEAVRLVDFARRWVAYGGAPVEEIFVNFGVGELEFYRRLALAIDELSTGPIERRKWTLLRTFCASAIVQLEAKR